MPQPSPTVVKSPPAKMPGSAQARRRPANATSPSKVGSGPLPPAPAGSGSAPPPSGSPGAYPAYPVDSRRPVPSYGTPVAVSGTHYKTSVRPHSTSAPPPTKGPSKHPPTSPVREPQPHEEGPVKQPPPSPARAEVTPATQVAPQVGPSYRSGSPTPPAASAPQTAGGGLVPKGNVPYDGGPSPAASESWARRSGSPGRVAGMGHPDASPLLPPATTPYTPASPSWQQSPATPTREPPRAPEGQRVRATRDICVRGTVLVPAGACGTLCRQNGDKCSVHFDSEPPEATYNVHAGSISIIEGTPTSPAGKDLEPFISYSPVRPGASEPKRTSEWGEGKKKSLKHLVEVSGAQGVGLVSPPPPEADWGCTPQQKAIQPRCAVASPSEEQSPSAEGASGQGA
eukprot:Hpha_TRINITY_DN11520_c0_g1::TRINITY_DN11520_c0_g1_i1::g.32290::m.32290